jgi:hypothetical protein
VRTPVTITPEQVATDACQHRGLPTARCRADPHRAGRLEIMPDGLFEEFKQTAAAYERERDGS